MKIQKFSGDYRFQGVGLQRLEEVRFWGVYA